MGVLKECTIWGSILKANNRISTKNVLVNSPTLFISSSTKFIAFSDIFRNGVEVSLTTSRLTVASSRPFRWRKNVSWTPYFAAKAVWQNLNCETAYQFQFCNINAICSCLKWKIFRNSSGFIHYFLPLMNHIN